MSLRKFPKTKLDRWNEGHEIRIKRSLDQPAGQSEADDDPAPVVEGRRVATPREAADAQLRRRDDEARAAAEAAFIQSHTVDRRRALWLSVNGRMRAERSLSVGFQLCIIPLFLAAAGRFLFTEVWFVALALLFSAAGLFVSAREAAAVHVLRLAAKDLAFRTSAMDARIVSLAARTRS